jgi:tetratricopeptide (TPR) repeat protein
MLKLAQVQAISGNNAAADSMYRALVEKDSTSNDAKFALLEMGKTQYKAKDYPTAVSTLTRRIALDPNSDEAYYYRGLSHKELKELPEAVADLRQAVVLAPTKGDRYFWLAVAQSQAGAADSALAGFRAMVAVDSTSKNASTAYQQIGFDYLKKKDWAAAIPFLEKSVAIDPTNKQSLIWLGQAYQNSGNKTKAIEYYDRVLQMDPNEPNASKGKAILMKGPAKGSTNTKQ